MDAAITVGSERFLPRGKWQFMELLAHPATCLSHAQRIEAAHRAYDGLWPALGWVRERLIASGILRELKVTVAVPKMQPWMCR